MKYKHIILTRFNLGLYTDNPYKIENPDKWMDTRIKLFESTAFPSIMKQTNRNFTWLMAFDLNTPERFTRLYDYCDKIEVCFEQPHLFLRNQEPEAEWLITTRLDNDDIIEPHFIDEIQRQFRAETEIIDVDYIKTDFRFKAPSFRKRPNSPFLSLIEKWEKNIITAMGYPHSTMPDYFPARKIDKVLAKMVIHENNIINTF